MQRYPKRQRDTPGVPDAARDADLTLRGHPAPAHTTPGQQTPTQMMQGHTNKVCASAFFKDGRRVVTGSWDHTLRIWDMQKGAVTGGPFQGHKNEVLSVAVSPDDRRIASGGKDNTVIIWDVEGKQMVFEPLVNHTDWVRSVCFSPDGKRLASSSDDKTVVVWSAETGAVFATFKGHRYEVLNVAFSPDGLKLASASSDRTVRVWRADNADLLLEINAHKKSVRSVVWSPDGQQLVSASWDQTIKFWNSSNGGQINQPCTGHTDDINSLAMSSDGSFIATASDDSTVRLWSTKTHQQIGQVLDHTAVVWCVAISPNGELLMSASDHGLVCLWFIKAILKQHKVEEGIKDGEEAQGHQLLTLSDTQPRSHDTNDEPTGHRHSPSNPPSESHEASGSQDKHALFDILGVNTAIHSSCITGDLHTAEKLLTQEIDANDNDHDSHANRSVIRARNSEWDKALRDAVKSIAIRPSLLGYIAKAIALCGNEQLLDAMEAFDLAFVFLNRDPITVDLLLLIKAVALFNASRHDEAVRRVQDLATAYKRSDTLPCKVVNLYLRVQLAMIAFEDGQYAEAADRLNDSIPSITDLFSRRELVEPRLKIFTVLFGWDLDSLWQSVNQRRCEALLRADRVIEAVESHQYMMRMIDEGANDSDLEWSTAFKQNCTARCLTKGNEAIAASNYEAAIELYSGGIGLDPSCESLFAHRSKANLEGNFYVEALRDAERVIELNSSSYVGYELMHTALHGAQRYDEAIEAFKIMLLKFKDAPDAQIRMLHQQYVNPSEVEDIIRSAVHARLENTPLRLLNTSTGRLCDREAQTNAFMESAEYKELLSSSMTHAPLQTKPIAEAVVQYFSWVMLSHRWESKELLLRDVQDKVVYDLDSVGTTVKLQKFCEVTREAGYRWAWSDTCCIDQNNSAELQRSVNSMFVWYRLSALTIVYLSDVPPSAQSGALANSAWNTRGWTIQEFLAPNIIIFYGNDWTPYLDDPSPNHKMSDAIMMELKDSTGIDAQALIAFRPGMTGAREKLQWASTRVTTLQEDIAYSLFGIFGAHLPVIYGETKQNALGRLLQEIVARSGDITALDWVGKSSDFNSCLPADITSYKAPPCTLPSLSEHEMQTSVFMLRNAVTMESASKFYTLLDKLSAPRFADSRLRLPCLAFPVTEVRRRHGQDQETCFTYYVKAVGLQDLSIVTGDKLIQFSRTRPTEQTFLLIRPWNRYNLGLPDFADNISVKTWSTSWSLSDHSLSCGSLEACAPIDSESHSRALRLIARLGQPFSALLLAQQRGEEYKRIASDNNIIAQVKDMTAVDDMMDVRTLEIL